MQVFHSPVAMSVLFGVPRLVASAGLGAKPESVSNDYLPCGLPVYIAGFLFLEGAAISALPVSNHM